MVEDDTGSTDTPQAVTKEQIQAWFATDEGKAWYQPQVDSAIGKAITTHDEKRQPEIDKALADKDTEIATLTEKAKAEKMTVEERLDAVEKREEATKREMDAKDRASLLREKVLSWKAGIVKRGLPEETHVDPTLSLEDGEKHLDVLKAAIDVKVKADVNKGLGAGTPPGSGNEPPPGEVPAGEPDATWTTEQVVAYEDKLREKARAYNRANAPEGQKQWSG